MFDTVSYDSILYYTRTKKKYSEHLSGFTGLCILHWILLLICVNWSINSLFVDFRPKIDFGQVKCSCHIESNKYFGNNSTVYWLGYGGDCLMQRQYIVKIIGNVSDWLSYAGGALIKVANSAGSTVYDYPLSAE